MKTDKEEKNLYHRSCVSNESLYRQKLKNRQAQKQETLNVIISKRKLINVFECTDYVGGSHMYETT